MKNRIVLKAVKGKCGDCFFAESGQCIPMPCDKGMIYIEDTEQGWIKVSDALPKEDGMYNVIMHCGSISPKLKSTFCVFRKGKFPRLDWDYVTHWMPKPDPPKAEPVCPECKGTGDLYFSEPEEFPVTCPKCNGTGKEVE